VSEQEQENPRVSLGLHGAEEGNVASAASFARWLNREATTLGFISPLPKPVREQFQRLAQVAQEVAVFSDGFNEGVQHSQKSDHRS
jgi:hypothetical protein